MKTLKSFKFTLLVLVIFSMSACELIEEPNFDEAEPSGETASENKPVD